MPASVTPIRQPDEEGGFETATWDYRGVRYKFREVTVEEYDKCIDAAMNPDGNTINNRTLTRLLVLAASVEPKGFSLGDLVKMPYRVYQHLVELVNDLIDPDKIPLDPSSSTPAGSDEPK